MAVAKTGRTWRRVLLDDRAALAYAERTRARGHSVALLDAYVVLPRVMHPPRGAAS